jgi:hypothetical protein
VNVGKLIANLLKLALEKKRDVPIMSTHFLFNNRVPDFVLPRNSSRSLPNSISVEYRFHTVFVFKHPVSALYVIVLLTIAR